MNSSRKGGAFERKIAKAISLAISRGENPHLLARTKMSGGVVTREGGANAANRAIGGDLCAVGGGSNIARLAMNFCDSHYIELKDRKNLKCDARFFHCKGELYRIWEHTVKAAFLCDKRPLLIYREYRGRIYAIANARHNAITYNDELHVLAQRTDDWYLYDFAALVYPYGK